MVSYAVSYEKDISDRPLRCRMDPFAIVSAHSESRGKTPHPLLARCSRRHLLRLKKRLPLAATSPRLPFVVYRLLSFRKVPIERVVLSDPQGHACRLEEEGGQGSPTYGGSHGLPERQNHRRIGPSKRLRRPQLHRQQPVAGPQGVAAQFGLDEYTHFPEHRRVATHCPLPDLEPSRKLRDADPPAGMQQFQHR